MCSINHWTRNRTCPTLDTTFSEDSRSPGSRWSPASTPSSGRSRCTRCSARRGTFVVAAITATVVVVVGVEQAILHYESMSELREAFRSAAPARPVSA